jgi:hypothetical protein
MTTGLFKRLPYGNSDFRDIILQWYACIDKTRFIEDLEKEDNRNHFFFVRASSASQCFLQRCAILTMSTVKTSSNRYSEIWRLQTVWYATFTNELKRQPKNIE